MRRRFVWIQGKAAGASLKILLQGPDGFCVGGGASLHSITLPGSHTSVYLHGITSTGLNDTDWVVAGIGLNGSAQTEILFFNSTGLIGNYVALSQRSVTGHYATTRASAGIFGQNYQSFRSSGTSGTANSASTTPHFGIVGHDVAFNSTHVGLRLNATYPINLREFVLPGLNSLYAVFIGNAPASGAFPSGNPWIYRQENIGGSIFLSFERLSLDLNSAIPNSDLIGSTIYTKDVSFINNTPWVSAGANTVSVTPHAIAFNGTVTTGDAFTVNYTAPDPLNYQSIDASLWVA